MKRPRIEDYDVEKAAKGWFNHAKDEPKPSKKKNASTGPEGEIRPSPSNNHPPSRRESASSSRRANNSKRHGPDFEGYTPSCRGNSSKRQARGQENATPSRRGSTSKRSLMKEFASPCSSRRSPIDRQRVRAPFGDRSNSPEY